jgi:hypothetical protein
MLTEEQIIEGNILIAKYLGYVFPGDEVPVKGAVLLNSNGYTSGMFFRFEDMQFHEKWEHIMPVVEKIAVDYDISIWWYDKECVCTIKNTSIEHSEVADCGNHEPAILNVWMAIVQLLKSLG